MINHLSSIVTIMGMLLLTYLYAQSPDRNQSTKLQLSITPKLLADSTPKIEIRNEKMTSARKSFIIELEFRPRMEYRNGYRQLPNDTTSAAYFGTHRSRLSFTYAQPKFKFHTSIQDVRVWGQYGQSSIAGSLSVFETFVESNITECLSVKIGRQKVELDNKRLFSESNWTQAGKAHDGISLIYKNKKITSEVLTFFNQTSERLFETNFSPATFDGYKLLGIHYLQTALTPCLSLTTINAADGYQSKTNASTLYVRSTSGGRLEYEKRHLYFTLSGYYQYGQLQSGKEISAYYIQPECRYKVEKFTTCLGAEYMSGDNATTSYVFSKSFVPLYGSTSSFLGSMHYFIAFPNDVKNGGLINPYLFLLYEINKKLQIRSDAYLFYLQKKMLDVKGNKITPYLGYENDWKIKYMFNAFTTLCFGISYMFAEKSMEVIKGGNASTIPLWSYLMITFQPELLNFRK